VQEDAVANRSLFGTLMGRFASRPVVHNEAGGRAYARTPAEALAQYVATGCFNATFYADAEEQLDRVLKLSRGLPPEFLAKAAIYGREHGRMKDMPALLVAVLAEREAAQMDRVFARVIDTPRMLRTFVQMVRSGVTGRKSFGTVPRRAVRRWLDARSDEAVFAASVGNDPSMADIIRIVHPKPASSQREALYGYLLGREVPMASLPAVVQRFEAFKSGDRTVVPDVPFQMLTALDLGPAEWREIARHASWQMTRMNLNTFARHRVFDDPGVTDLVASRLCDAERVSRAGVLPYQLLAACRAADASVPGRVRGALEDALELALANVPVVEGQVYVCPDVSGSMRSPVTGHRAGATTAVRCVDVAALVAAAILRKNPTAGVLPFEQNVVDVRLSPRDTVMTNADRLAAVGGGGTSVSAPLARLNERRAKGDLVVVVSDNESWVDARNVFDTATIAEWNVFRRRNPAARLALIDIQPSATTQAVERDDVLNIGGFSDHVFELLADFAAGRMERGHWVGAIEAIAL
jgi:60 kDa SS-A/Ro ribonucleoprotein